MRIMSLRVMQSNDTIEDNCVPIVEKFMWDRK